MPSTVTSETTGNRRQLSARLLILAGIYTAFHLGPPFWRQELGYLVTAGDAADFVTPLVMLLAVYGIAHRLWRLPLSSKIDPAAHRFIPVLIIGAALFVEGHGMHLSANAIARHLTSQVGTPLYAVTYFFDEILGHMLWDGGILILSLGLLGLEPGGRAPSPDRPRPIFIALGALLYGFTYFCNAIEGQTVILTFPAAVIVPVALLYLTKRRHQPIQSHPVSLFFAFAYGVAVILFVVWWLWRGGFPEFSSLGWV